MKRELASLLLVLTAIGYGVAQDTVTLKLQDALEAAVENNREIMLATFEQESAVARYNQTNSLFLPQVNLVYSAIVTNNPLNVLGLKLQQQVVSPTDFNPGVLNHPSAVQNYTTEFRWNQPLLNFDIIYQRKAMGRQMDVYQHRTRRTKEYVQFEIQKAFAQLQLAQQGVNVFQEALRAVNASFETAKNYFEKGYIQKSDLLLIQIKVISIESKLAEAKSTIGNASENLSLLMGAKAGVIYKVEQVEKKPQPETVELQVSENRSDLKALESALKAQEAVIHSVRMSYLPRLNAFVSYMFNDKAAFGFGANAYMAGAQFSWNLFSGTTRRHSESEQEVAYKKLERQRSYLKEQSQLELNKTHRQFKDVQFTLRQHEAGVIQASEALRINENRFQQGLVSVSDLLQSQSTLSEQKLLLAEAVFKYNITLAYLRLLTFSN